MMRTKHAVLILLALSCTVVFGKEEEPFYDQLTRAVIRLEHEEICVIPGTLNLEVRTVPDGTAFFVGGGVDLYVVSARHVVDTGYDLYSRVRARNRKTGVWEVVRLELPRTGWSYHPDGGDKDTHYVDVAAMKIPWSTDCAIRHFGYHPEDPNMKNQLPLVDAAPPEPILVFGFPGDLGFRLVEQCPMARLGIMSMSAGKEFLMWDGKTFVEERCCLIDSRMFPGNSGGPIMNQPRFGNSKPRLLGLVIATNRRLDYGVIEPVSRIRETLDIAKNKPAGGVWRPIPKKTKPIAGPNTPN
jgi:hypothetical protein